jgi:hypothetical protein
MTTTSEILHGHLGFREPGTRWNPPCRPLRKVNRLT